MSEKTGTATAVFPGRRAAAEDKILFIPEITNFGGGERIYLSLSKFLHSREIPHRIVSYYHKIALQDYAGWPLKIELLSPRRNPITKAWAMKQFLTQQKALGADRPLLFGIQPALHAAGVGLDRYALIILDTPSLLSKSKTPRSPLKRAAVWARTAVSERLTRIGLHRADPVIITTAVMAAELEELYGLRPVVSYQGVAGDSACYRYRPLTSGTPLRFLSVCRLEGNKRIDWMLRSLAALEEHAALSARKEWRLDVVGEGSREAELRSLAAALRLENRIVFHGLVSDARLEEIYGEADVFLMPAVQGYGLPALESLTRKIPVVMHAQSGVSEVLGGTPWVEIIAGGEETLTLGIETMVSRLMAGELSEKTLPDFPTESQWAEEVCRLCGWLESNTSSDVKGGHSA